MRSSVLAGVYKLSVDVLFVASAHLPVLRIRDYSPEQVTVYQCEYVNSVCGTPKLTEPDVYNWYMLHRSNDVHAKMWMGSQLEPVRHWSSRRCLEETD